MGAANVVLGFAYTAETGFINNSVNDSQFYESVVAADH